MLASGALEDFVDGGELLGELGGVVGFGEAEVGAVLVEFAALFRGVVAGVDDDGEGLEGGVMSQPGDEFGDGAGGKAGVGDDEIWFGEEVSVGEAAGAEEVALGVGEVERGIDLYGKLGVSQGDGEEMNIWNVVFDDEDGCRGGGPREWMWHRG